MLNTVQCQNPVLVGASGSNNVTTKLCAAGGAPVHDSCGELFPPPHPLNAVVTGSVAPDVNVVLVTVIGVALDGLAGAANGRAVVAGAGAAACALSATVPADPPLAAPVDPDVVPDAVPEGVQAAVPSPTTIPAT
jgi:hypothetical protein